MTLSIRCEDLHKQYIQRGKPPVHAVRGLDLEVPAGVCFGLLGPNGAGKTTTVEIFEGLLEPTSGTVEVLGQHWDRDGHALRQRLGISLQETRLSDKVTAFETLRLFRSFYREGLTPDELLDAVNLQEKANTWVVNMSGGQRQRLAVACALVGAPELLFLDEPTTGLDPQARRDVWDIIRGQRDRGCSILLTTHYMDEAERLCDHIAVIDHGKVIALGTPDELIASLGGDHVIDLALANGTEEPPAIDAATAEFSEQDAATWTALAGVRSARRAGPMITLTVSELHVALPMVLRHLEAEGLNLARLTTRHASLEDVFVNLTGRHLTDEEEGPDKAK
jgi:ABC-2 type transport system ATP-binding protein